MRLSIFTKLFVSILLVCVVMLGSMVWLINSSFQEGFQSYLNNGEVEKAELIADKVKIYYSPKFGWQRLTSAPYLWATVLTQFGEPPPPQDIIHDRLPPKNLRGDHPPSPEFDRAGQIRDKKDSLLVPLSLRTNLFDAQGRSILGIKDNLKYNQARFQQVRIDIVVDGKVVGWLSILQSKSISGDLAKSFFYEQTKYTFTVLALMILFSFGIAFFLVRHFLKPLKALHEGATAIESGDLDIHIDAKGSDELTELTIAFNRLALALKKQKHDREQWLSDISHELRTPIAVLRSEIEAMQDGIRKPEPKYIASLHHQTMTLGKLVNDLYELSVSDSGVNFDFKVIDNIGEIVSDVVSQNEFRLRKNQLVCNVQSALSGDGQIFGDSKSLNQLILNLLENSIRYTDQPGSIAISVTEDNQDIKLLFNDSFPGVPDESLPLIFDRLYRVDKSRSRVSGGSGIGLSICKNIVEAHGGSIVANHSPMGGLAIAITLPKAKG